MKVKVKLLEFAIFILLFLIILKPCFANVNVYIKSIDNILSKEDKNAKFLIYIYNGYNQTLSFNLDFGVQPDWTIISFPFYSLKVEPNENKSFEVYIMPRAYNLPPDNYLIPFYVQYYINNEKKKIEKNLMIRYGKIEGEEKSYEPTVKMYVQIFPSNEIDPRKPIKIQIWLRNYNILNLSNLRINVLGKVIKGELNTSLGPLEKKTVIMDIKIDPKTSPQEDKLVIALEYHGKIISLIDNIFVRIKRYENITRRIERKKGFLKKTITYIITNNGNDEDSYELLIPTDYFKRLFLKTNPKYVLYKKYDRSFLYWKFKLNKGQTIRVELNYNYTNLLLILILTSLLICGYFLLRSPIVIKKEAKITYSDEGRMIKIMLNIRNRSNKEIKDIVIKDIIPPIMRYIKEEQIGIIKPLRIVKNPTKGTLLEWRIDVMYPKEERIISYKIDTKLNVIGELRLSSAKLTFKIKNKEKVTKSNSIVLSI